MSAIRYIGPLFDPLTTVQPLNEDEIFEILWSKEPFEPEDINEFLEANPNWDGTDRLNQELETLLQNNDFETVFQGFAKLSSYKKIAEQEPEHQIATIIQQMNDCFRMIDYMQGSIDLPQETIDRSEEEYRRACDLFCDWKENGKLNTTLKELLDLTKTIEDFSYQKMIYLDLCASGLNPEEVIQDPNLRIKILYRMALNQLEEQPESNVDSLIEKMKRAQ